MVFFHDPASLELLSPSLKQTARMLAQLCSSLSKHRIYLCILFFSHKNRHAHNKGIRGIRRSCKQMSTQPKEKFAPSLPTKKRPPSWTVGSPAAEKAAQMAYFVSWRLYASTTWGTCWAVEYMIPKAFKKKWTMDFADSQLQHFLDSPTEKIAQSLHGHVILDSLVFKVV